MSAPDPRVTLTEAEREALGDWWDDPADLGLNHLYPVVERIVAERLAARLAPIRAVIDGPIGTHKERPDEYGAWYRGARHLRVALRRALDAPSEAPSGPESAEQGSGGAEGWGESVRVGFRYQDGEVLSPEREAQSEDEEMPVAVIDIGDGEWLTLAELRDLHAERLEGGHE